MIFAAPAAHVGCACHNPKNPPQSFYGKYPRISVWSDGTLAGYHRVYPVTGMAELAHYFNRWRWRGLWLRVGKGRRPELLLGRDSYLRDAPLDRRRDHLIPTRRLGKTHDRQI